MYQNLKRSFALIALLLSAVIVHAQTYPNEVWKSGSTYYWRINGTTAGSSSSLSTAINSCMGTGREVHVTTGGTLDATLNVPGSNVKLYGHGNTFTCSFTGTGISNSRDGFEIHDLTLTNVVGGYGIRSSAASNLSFTDLNLTNIDWIGIRIDSRSSNPWNYTEYNLYMRDIYVDNIGSHGVETYSIDGVTIEGTITARNTGGCGVLFNKTFNGTVSKVDAYNCDWLGGYAGLRYANGCNNITTDTLLAEHCGRGFFIVQSGPTVEGHVNYAEIRNCSDVGIWIENGTNCSVKAGCNDSGTTVSGSGSYANVSGPCDGGSSSSNAVWLEAECATVGSLWNVNSDVSAANGQAVEIQPGNTSGSSAPGTSGQLNFTFNVAQAGTYNVWGRVIAPTASDDSFWVRVDGGNWIKWNNIDLGSTWHWDKVHDENNGNQVVDFTLSAGSHTLDIGYREDGAQLDKIFIDELGNTPAGVGETASNCGSGGNQSPIADAGADQTVTDTDDNGSESVTLNGTGSSDPDGTIASYVWTEGGTQIATGSNPSVTLAVGAHTITLTVTDDQGATATDDVVVTVNAPSTSSNTVWLEAECGTVGSLWNTPADGSASNGTYASVQAGNNSLSSAPSSANGRITYNFDVSETGSYKVWGRVIAPTVDEDSYWVRMDGGSWIKWNNIAPGSSWHWDEVHNADNGNSVVTFSLTAGSHTFDVAYREEGTKLDKLYVTNQGDTPSGAGGSATNCGGARAGDAATNKVQAAQFMVYPNPASEVLHLRFADDSAPHQVTITDMSGRAYINLETSANEKSVDLHGLAKGYYVVSVNTGGIIETKVLIKK